MAAERSRLANCVGVRLGNDNPMRLPRSSVGNSGGLHFCGFSVQKVTLLTGDGAEGCRCLGNFIPTAVLFPEGISPIALSVNLVLAVLLAFAAAKPRWFATAQNDGGVGLN